MFYYIHEFFTVTSKGPVLEEFETQSVKDFIRTSDAKQVDKGEPSK